MSAARFEGELPPEIFNMAEYTIARAAENTPDKEALLVFDDPNGKSPYEVYTYQDLDGAVLRLAAGLQDLGLEPQSRVIINLGNTSDYALLFFGAIAAGLIPLPASDQATPGDIEFLIDDCSAQAIAVPLNAPQAHIPGHVHILTAADVTKLKFHDRRAVYAPTKSNDPAYLIYTSGTTSKPKGVLHAHRAAWGRRPMYKDWYAITQNDRMLHAGAFNWTYTLGTGLTDPWANGATSIIYTGKKSPELWANFIPATRATLFAAVPGVIRQILKYARPAPGSLSPLRHALVAGETPPPGLFEDWKTATGTELYEALGMSEISTYISSSPSTPRKPNTIGKPQTGRAIAILPEDDQDSDKSTEPLPVDAEGLLAVHKSDPGLMLGYWKRPEEEAEVFRGAWFIGGDLAVFDEDGYVTHLGRANDVMKALGYRVAPQEVEAALSKHPEIADVACRELKVRADVSVVAAFVVPKDWTSLPSKEDILEFAGRELASYKCPREIRFVRNLPRTPNGKLKRSGLAD